MLFSNTKNFRRLLLHTFLKQHFILHSYLLFYPKQLRTVKYKINSFFFLNISSSFFSFYSKQKILGNNLICFPIVLDVLLYTDLFNGGFIKYYNLFCSLFILRSLFVFVRYCFFFIKKIFFSSFLLFGLL